MIKEAIKMLVEGMNLSEPEMMEAMRDIMDGRATDAQIASFLTALRIKGETIDEITGAAKVMREMAAMIKAPEDALDTCGTGGDLAHTFNISTTTAIVVAAAGVPVAKHGNRSVSSKSGSADVLEALGVRIDLPPEKVERCLEETGFCFMFAPIFHPAMKYAIGPRREMGIRTIFNILGPLTNPAMAKNQVLGVFSDNLTDTLAYVLGNLGVKHAFVVHGEDGLDEMTITGRTRVSELKDGKVETYLLEPQDFGIPRGRGEDLIGGDARDNANIMIDILRGEKGAKRDIVVMNSSIALMAANKAYDIREAVEEVTSVIDSGLAMEKLEEIKEVTNRL